MRLGTIWAAVPNAYYRAADPMRAMAQRGHQVVFPPGPEVEVEMARLAGCDVVHVYRLLDDETWQVMGELARRGTAITYDNDDDYTSVPEECPLYHKIGGVWGERLFEMSVAAARKANVFTTTSEVLADKYRRAGVDPVVVIPNRLYPDRLRPREHHDGLVIGWVAGSEHQADVTRIGIADALARLLAKHEHVRVECIGIDLGLPDRYRHDQCLLFQDLPARIAGWDIGIAPLADIPYNRARSGIKVQEYAASGVPWLASPVGPYVGLGEQQGGRLVPDDGWFDALDRLVASDDDRALLARHAQAWARSQTIEGVADRWERVFAAAADAAGRSGLAGAHVA